MEKRFRVKLTGPGINLDAPVSELQAKMVLNIAFAPASVSDSGAGMAALDAPSVPQGIHAGVSQSPRDFIALKNPMTEQERITCLAYYLYKFRKVEKFSSKELRDVNSLAAQPRFNNISYTARDAATTGYLASVGGGKKMLSALGERIVDAMPDRGKVADTLKKFGKKNRRKPTARTAK